MKTKVMKAALAIVLAMSALTGCAVSGTEVPSANRTKTAESTGTKAQESIVFWSTKEDCFETDAALFKEKSEISVNATFMGGYDDMVNKVMAGIAADSLPDIAQLGQRHGISQMYDSGKLIAAEDLMPKELMDDIFDGFWKRFTYKDKKVILPFQNSMPVLYYNKTKLEEKKVSVPATLNEVVTAAKTLTDEGNYYGFSTNDDTPWYALALLYNNGVTVAQSNTDVSINTPEAKAVFEAYQQMAVTDKSMPANQHATAQEDFANGKVMLFMSSCASYAKIDTLVGDKFEVGVAAFPSIVTMDIPMGGNGLGFFRSTPEKEAAAVKFATFMLEPERVAANTLTSGYIPVRNAAIETDTYKEYLQDPNRAIIHEQLEKLGGRGVNPADSLIWEEVGRLIDAVEADPALDIEKELDSIQAAVGKYLNEYAGK